MKEENYNLEFTAKVGTQNRLAINPVAAEIAELKAGDSVTLILKKVYRQ